MIAKASAIQHGQAMTNYATKNNRADIVKTNLLNEGLPPMGMWDEMVLHQSMFKQRYAKKPIELTSIRFELSHLRKRHGTGRWKTGGDSLTSSSVRWMASPR